MNYTVRWEIEIDAETPEEAAREALKIQRDPESTATVFDVEPESKAAGKGLVCSKRVDLTESDGEFSRLEEVKQNEGLEIAPGLPTDEQYIEQCQQDRRTEEDGAIDFDDRPKVSRSGDDGESGAYVNAWLWVDRSDVQPGYDDED